MRAISACTATYAVVTILTVACTDTPTRVTGPNVDTDPTFARSGKKLDRLKDWLRSPNGGASAPILVGAGDIAECYQGSTPPPANTTVNTRQSAAERTARLLDRIPGTVIAVGDNAYQFGSTFDYETCYEPTWGRHYDRTKPATGNHEYMSAAEGYLAYFGPRGGPPGLYYYSYDVASWHVVVLNSTTQVYMCYPPDLSESENESDEWWDDLFNPELTERPTTAALGRTCLGDAAQQVWLEADLTTHASAQCTLVYFHHARFSSGRHGNHYQMQKIWDILYKHGVDVAVTGHDHHYERFAPLDLNGYPHPLGIRQFVVGTGGADLRPVAQDDQIKHSEIIVDDTHGVIALALRNGTYDWAFIGVDRSVRDSGAGSCHGAPPA
jgi:hypothetical protein